MLRTLSEKNIQIPDQMSILTFDDAEWTNILRPTVSVLSQPIEEIAKLAWSNMKALLKGEDIGSLSIRLQGKLIIRDSVSTKRKKGEKFAS